MGNKKTTTIALRVPDPLKVFVAKLAAEGFRSASQQTELLLKLGLEKWASENPDRQEEVQELFREIYG